MSIRRTPRIHVIIRIYVDGFPSTGRTGCEKSTSNYDHDQKQQLLPTLLSGLSRSIGPAQTTNLRSLSRIETRRFP